MPHIVEVCAYVLGHGKKLADPDTVRKMVMLVRQMQASLPPEVRLSQVGLQVRSMM